MLATVKEFCAIVLLITATFFGVSFALWCCVYWGKDMYRALRELKNEKSSS